MLPAEVAGGAFQNGKFASEVNFMLAKRAISVAALGLLLSLWPAAAQSDRGTITGAVMDTSGAFVPKAELVLNNVETGVVSHAQTNEAGLYTFPMSRTATTT
jgi:hypothetical protein